MDLKALKVDSARIEGGDWVGDIPGMGNLRLRVRGFGSATYRAALEKARRGVARADLNRDGTMPPAVADRVTGQAMYEAALLDWQNLEQDGAPVAFDRTLALTLLTDPDFRAFRDAVVFACNDVAEAESRSEAALMGNSATS